MNKKTLIISASLTGTLILAVIGESIFSNLSNKETVFASNGAVWYHYAAVPADEKISHHIYNR